jgi:hypothetical protein
MYHKSRNQQNQSKFAKPESQDGIVLISTSDDSQMLVLSETRGQINF